MQADLYNSHEMVFGFLFFYSACTCIYSALISSIPVLLATQLVSVDVCSVRV